MKRLLSAILASLMLLSLAACGNSVPIEDTSVAVDTAEVLPAGIEKKDYGNAEVCIAYPNWGLYPNYFHSDENTGEAIHVALYNREMKVEEHLGVDITHTMLKSIEAVTADVRQYVMANEDVYQIVLNHCINGISGLITDGMLYDLSDIETVDTTSDWWNTKSMENLAVGAHQYCAINDYMIPDPNAVIFNKGFVQMYEIDDPYDIVREGNWTIDVMMEMMKTVTKDNGDGQWDINDTYGFGCPGNWFLNDFIYSSGLMLTEKNEDGGFELAFDVNERTVAFSEKLNALLTGPDTFSYSFQNDYPDSSGFQGEDKSLNVKRGRTLFGLVSLNNLHTYRDTNVEFGLLPYPKLDADQESYNSLDWSGVLVVPASVQEPEMVGEVIELLAYYSKDEVLPAYYDLVLGEKLSRDEDSKEMLDIIFDGIIFDAGMNYFGFSPNMSKIFYIGQSIEKTNWSGLSSFIATCEMGAKAEVEKFNTAVLEME